MFDPRDMARRERAEAIRTAILASVLAVFFLAIIVGGLLAAVRLFSPVRR